MNLGAASPGGMTDPRHAPSFWQTQFVHPGAEHLSSAYNTESAGVSAPASSAGLSADDSGLPGASIDAGGQRKARAAPAPCCARPGAEAGNTRNRGPAP